MQGSIALKGGRIDDLSLLKFRETVDPKSPPVVLLSPSGGTDPFYAEFGWTASTPDVKVPGADTVWTQQGSGALDVGHPVTLTWNNGGGLEFRRTITVDDKFLFTVKDEVANKSDKPVDALSLCADLAPRHAADRAATTSCTKAWSAFSATACRKRPSSDLEDEKGIRLRQHQRLARHHRQILGGGAAAATPTPTG